MKEQMTEIWGAALTAPSSTHPTHCPGRAASLTGVRAQHLEASLLTTLPLGASSSPSLPWPQPGRQHSPPRRHDLCGFRDPLGFINDSIDVIPSMSPQAPSAFVPHPQELQCQESPTPGSSQDSSVNKRALNFRSHRTLCHRWKPMRAKSMRVAWMAGIWWPQPVLSCL